LVGLALSIETAEAAYIPIGHRYPGAPEQLDLEHVLARLKPWLESPSAAKAGHELKLAAHCLARQGTALAGVRYDAMLESYVLNSVGTRHDLDAIAAKYVGMKTVSF